MAHFFFIMPENDILNIGLEIADGFDPSAGNLDGSFLEQWLMPGKVQQREFGQQVAFQQMQNEWQSKENAKWNDIREEMKRRNEAGLNPLLANGNLQTGSPNSPSSVGGVPHQNAISPSDVAAVANAVTGGEASLAEAAFKRGTLQPTVENLNADVEKKLADIGLTNEEIYAWKVDNKYRDENAQADLRIKGLNEKNLAQQWNVLYAQYELMTTQIDTEIAKQKELYEAAKLSISQAGLADAEAAYYGALKRKTDYDADWQKIRIDFWNQHGFDILNSSTDAILVQKLENGQPIGNIVREMSDYYGKRVDAEEQAKAEYVYTNAHNAAAGANTANMEYEWNTPPKTMFEFFASAFVNLKEKFKSKPIPVEESKIDKATKSELRQSYAQFEAQKTFQKQCLIMQDADNRDNHGQIIDYDKHVEIQKAFAELEKLPKTFKQFIKYVSK